MITLSLLLIDEAYILLSIFIHLSTIRVLVIYTWCLGAEPTDLEAEMEAIEEDQPDEFHE